MMKRIYRYYGMCGTFKATTMKAGLKGSRAGYTLPVWSMIKPWKSLEKGVLAGYLRRGNNMDLAALGLCNLENVLKITETDPDIEFILAERGVLDNLFYCSLGGENIDRDKVKKIREEEIKLEEKYGFKEIRSTLLIMEDEEFIKEKILPSPTHANWFPDVETYLSQQENYVRFIFRNIGNESLRERRIVSAREYLKKIGLEYKD